MENAFGIFPGFEPDEWSNDACRGYVIMAMNSRLLPITRICCPYRIRDGTVHKAPLSNKIFPYKKAVRRSNV